MSLNIIITALHKNFIRYYYFRYRRRNCQINWKLSKCSNLYKDCMIFFQYFRVKKLTIYGFLTSLLILPRYLWLAEFPIPWTIKPFAWILYLLIALFIHHLVCHHVCMLRLDKKNGKSVFFLWTESHDFFYSWSSDKHIAAFRFANTLDLYRKTSVSSFLLLLSDMFKSFLEFLYSCYRTYSKYTQYLFYFIFFYYLL